MSSSQLRSLNKDGLQHFHAWLEQSRAARTRRSVPEHLLHDDRFSAALTVSIELPDHNFSSCWDAAERMAILLAPLPARELEGTDGLGNRGLWSWLALFYFSQVCPAIPGAANRYIPDTEGGTFRYYRHLLAGPFRLHRQLGERAKPALRTLLPEHNALYNALADHQDLVQNPDLVGAMNLLYTDSETGNLRRGTSNPHKAGSLARFFPVMNQLELTYDLLGLSTCELIELLPPEFDPWRVATESSP
jgi:hypothetical protein